MSKSTIKRLRVFIALVVVVILVLASRLAWLQVYQYDHYFAKAEFNRTRQLPITAPRGEIFDRNGELMVGNRPGFTVSLLDLPKREQPEVIHYLSELLEMDEEAIRDEIWKQRFSTFAPIRLKRDVSAEVVAKIGERRMDLPGVIIETEPIRNYVNNSLAAHVLGYVNKISSSQLQQKREQGEFYRINDLIGASGIESTWEHYLRGTEGKLFVEANSFGRRISVLGKEDPVPGHSLRLTIDSRLQEIAERSLAKVINEGIEAGNGQLGKGVFVAINPNNGEILAMVSYPSYNLNTVSRDFNLLTADRDNPLFNKAFSGGYPVGSTFKMAVAVAALEEGIINERSIITCTGRKQFFTGDVLRGCFNNAVHGSLNVVDAIAKSCNIFFFELGVRLGIDRVISYAEELSLGSATGMTDLGRENLGILLRRKPGVRWNPGDVLTAAIGQGHMITPLQLANYTAMLANSGTHYKPHLVSQVVNHQGETVFVAEPEILNQLNYSEKTWAAVQKGMEATAKLGGTASVLRNLPVQVAAKTGSAESIPGWSAHSLFTGYAPAQAPEIAFVIIVEHGGLGYQAAVPVANLILGEYYAN
ncbi:MAG: penicillin-binding protein 2 [Dethiobacter sp.]|jgi:penicillin-binding protein 2|nr:penicillin-binding protein 2 [Dethiobacter sp.]